MICCQFNRFSPSWKIFTRPSGWEKSPDFIFLFSTFIDYFDVLCAFHNILLLFKQIRNFRRCVRLSLSLLSSSMKKNRQINWLGHITRYLKKKIFLGKLLIQINMQIFVHFSHFENTLVRCVCIVSSYYQFIVKEAKILFTG